MRKGRGWRGGWRKESWFTTGEKLQGEFEWVLEGEGRGWLGLVLITRNENGRRTRDARVGFSRDVIMRYVN